MERNEFQDLIDQWYARKIAAEGVQVPDLLTSMERKGSSRVHAVKAAGLHTQEAEQLLPLLLQLLNDEDPDVQMCACLSIMELITNSSTQQVSNVVDAEGRSLEELITALVDNEDRFVRASAALALGALGCEGATGAIKRLWRCDFISDVREAARVALQLMPGKEAEQYQLIENEIDQMKRQLVMEQLRKEAAE